MKETTTERKQVQISKTEKAKLWAIAAHNSIKQKRKYTRDPYWVHVVEVGEIVEAAPGATEDMVCAAYLHDVIEDVFPENPIYNRQEIKNEFGQRVMDLVEQLTDEYTKERYPKLNRAERKHWERQRLSAIDNEAKTIKLADIISNTKDIVEHGGEFAPVYLREKRELLPYLRGGEGGLFALVEERIGTQAV